MKLDQKINRRDFLKLSGLTAGALLLPKGLRAQPVRAQSFPSNLPLGRVCAGDIGAWHEIKTEPNVNAPRAALAWRDDVLEIKQEVIANVLDYNRFNQKWFEVPGGYIYAPMVQPVKNLPNLPLTSLPLDHEGKPGLWVEITVPWVELQLTKAKSNASFWISSHPGTAKLYYSQVYWASDIRQNNGRTEYLLSEKYGALPDYYWVDASACRPIDPQELTPIHPDVADKHIRVSLYNQTLSAFEGGREVYFCEVSTGYVKEGKWQTPPGTTPVWRKLVSLHMSAGGVSPYDSPGIGWTTLFHSEGQAIHSVYWHNDFGLALSHGCVNCRPDDAKWLWRWTNPQVGYYPGELTVSGSADSTWVEVVES